jgi:hypothetical protein
MVLGVMDMVATMPPAAIQGTAGRRVRLPDLGFDDDF